MIELPYWFTSDTFAGLLNSSFSTALVGSLAGAYFGAKAAQLAAERSRDAEQLIGQMRATNAALTTSLTVCTRLLAFKRQHVKPMSEQFKKSLQEIHDHKAARDAGQPVPPIHHFVADLRTINPPHLPVERLERLVYDKLSVPPRPLTLTTALADVQKTVQILAAQRTNLIGNFKEMTLANSPLVVPLYFGLPYGGGAKNTEFPDLLNGLVRQTDDGIYFSKLLCDDLAAYGATITKQYSKKHKGVPLKIVQISLDDPRNVGLLPNAADYVDWDNAFPSNG